jgi:protein-S-isoprenylcysteine O-methyltransferase Ste14
MEKSEKEMIWIDRGSFFAPISRFISISFSSRAFQAVMLLVDGWFMWSEGTMSATIIKKNTIQGTIFLMITGGLILFAADGKVLLSQPIGAAFFVLWIAWWVIAFSLRSQESFSMTGKSAALQSYLQLAIILVVGIGAPWEYIHLSQPFARDGLAAWLGMGICLVSTLWIAASMWMIDNAAGVRKQQPAGAYLITGGPYRLVRHPGYLGVVLSILGIAISLSSLIAAAAFVITTAYAIVRIREEEKDLARIFGDAFTVNKTRTRWILFPGII